MYYQSADGGINTRSYEFTHGGGKGLPFAKNAGWQWFIYNVDSAASLSSGGFVHLVATHYGALLE